MFWSENYILWSQDKLAWFAEPNDKAECSPFLVELLPLFSQIIFGWKENNRNQTNSQTYIPFPYIGCGSFITQITEKDGYEHCPSSFSMKKVILCSSGLDENLLIALSLILDGK